MSTKTETATKDSGSEGGPPLDLLKTMGDGEVLAMNIETGHATMAFTVKPEFCHSGYICQGGFVAGWIDSAMAHAVIAKTNRTLSPATLEIKVTYLKAAIKGTRVKAEGWIEKQGKHVAFLEGHVLNEKDEVIAKATSTVQLMPIRS
jgi:acyl-CoA thioesterase